jgi:hypothetical protein
MSSPPENPNSPTAPPTLFIVTGVIRHLIVSFTVLLPDSVRRQEFILGGDSKPPMQFHSGLVEVMLTPPMASACLTECDGRPTAWPAPTLSLSALSFWCGSVFLPKSLNERPKIIDSGLDVVFLRCFELVLEVSVFTVVFAPSGSPFRVCATTLTTFSAVLVVFVVSMALRRCPYRVS